jgi:hypothetical protein
VPVQALEINRLYVCDNNTLLARVMSRELVGESAIGIFLLAYLLCVKTHTRPIRARLFTAFALQNSVRSSPNHTADLVGGRSAGTSTARTPGSLWDVSDWLDNAVDFLQSSEKQSVSEKLSSTQTLNNSSSFTASGSTSIGLVNK